MVQSNDLEILGKVYAQRGYLVMVARHNYSVGEIAHPALEGREIGQPCRILCETDLADFNEQQKIMGISEKVNFSEYRYYRVESD